MMQLEIEAKFIHVDHDAVRARLQVLGATCEQPMRLMRRAVFHSEAMERQNGFLRVRDEGYRITVTYKEFDGSDTIHGAKEIETTVGDFEAAVAMFEQTGLSKESYQETKRETWRLGDAEVVLDEWPWIDPYIEIEGPDEQAVQEAARQLGFDFKDALFGGVAVLYLESYPQLGSGKAAADIINRKLPLIRFEDPVPSIIISGGK